MKLLPHLCFAVSASALMVLALPLPAAHAFTFEGANTVTPDGSANLTDPASRFESNSSNNKVEIGGGTLQFGTRQQQSPGASFNEDANRLFNPLGGPGTTGRYR